MLLGFNFHQSFLLLFYFPLPCKCPEFISWHGAGRVANLKAKDKTQTFLQTTKSCSFSKWIFKSNHMWGSILAIASLSILSGMYVHGPSIMCFHLYFCLKISEGCRLNYIQRKCWHTTLPPSRQQKLQHAGNLTGRKPDTCAD